MTKRSSLPLSGIKVVEFCQILAGPFCGCLLADMGADVIKIESPEGDPMRSWAPLRGGFSQYFASLNRNKRAIALDLKNPAGCVAARALALSADIIIENFRPGVLARFGLDYENLRREAPALVYCSISAYGQTGPRASEGGFDVTLQAMSGAMSVTGERNGPPAKSGLPIADTTAGLYAAFSAVAALNRATATGIGEYIDISMLGGMLGVAHLQTSELFALGRDPVRLGSAHPMNAPYSAFRSRDGYFVLAAGTNSLWQKTCEVIARPDLAADPRFSTSEMRGQQQILLGELLEKEFVQRDSAEWLDLLGGQGIPCAPINSYSQVLADPQVKHAGLVVETPLPNGVTTQTIGPPQRLAGKDLGVYRRPPALGEHTDQILAEQSGPTQPSNDARFRAFVADFTRLVGRTSDEEIILDEGAMLLSSLVKTDDWLAAAAARPDPHHYQQYLLHCDPLERFSVVSFVWGPGQATPVHDHTVWGLVGVLRGAETSRHYSRTPSDGSWAAADMQRAVPGDVVRVSPTIGDIHEVANAYDDRVSISIHVYGGNIGTVNRHIFDRESGGTKPFVSGYANANIPNVWRTERAVASAS
jgi:crotonobetainyl-CoA:carnitine CoA-transferase CaiB-like acyl-CoA transferase/predicted metal-dependent enzyme (double-stranded beta helix superfamily)